MLGLYSAGMEKEDSAEISTSISSRWMRTSFFLFFVLLFLFSRKVMSHHSFPCQQSTVLHCKFQAATEDRPNNKPLTSRFVRGRRASIRGVDCVDMDIKVPKIHHFILYHAANINSRFLTRVIFSHMLQFLTRGHKPHEVKRGQTPLLHGVILCKQDTSLQFTRAHCYAALF